MYQYLFARVLAPQVCRYLVLHTAVRHVNGRQDRALVVGPRLYNSDEVRAYLHHTNGCFIIFLACVQPLEKK